MMEDSRFLVHSCIAEKEWKNLFKCDEYIHTNIHITIVAAPDEREVILFLFFLLNKFIGTDVRSRLVKLMRYGITSRQSSRKMHLYWF